MPQLHTAGASHVRLLPFARLIVSPVCIPTCVSNRSCARLLPFLPQQIVANPGMMSQAFNAMQSNPGMMAQAQQMMQDPATLQRVSQMDLNGAFQAGLGAGAAAGLQPAAGYGGQTLPTAPPAPASAQAPAAAPTPTPTLTPTTAAGNSESGGGGDDEEGQQEMTEDELIAEAIRRSMED